MLAKARRPAAEWKDAVAHDGVGMSRCEMAQTVKRAVRHPEPESWSGFSCPYEPGRLWSLGGRPTATHNDR